MWPCPWRLSARLRGQPLLSPAGCLYVWHLGVACGTPLRRPLLYAGGRGMVDHVESVRVAEERDK